MAACQDSSKGLPDELDAKVQTGKRIIDGDKIRYDLYEPSKVVDVGPTAGVLFLHGFAGGRAALAHHAQRIASRGARALAVDLTSLTKGGSLKEVFIDRSVRSAQLRNVRQAADHASWLGLCCSSLVLVGHSAGGAVALETAVKMQEAGHAPTAVVLLDAVPWEETSDVAAQFDLNRTALVSIRAEPSVWNKNGGIAEVLHRIAPGKPGRLVDLKVRGARHGDPMEPRLILKLLGVLGTGFEAITRLVEAHLCEALGIVASGVPSPADVVRELEAASAVEVTETATS